MTTSEVLVTEFDSPKIKSKFCVELSNVIKDEVDGRHQIEKFQAGTLW